MTKQNYNGWTNYETWLVKLWIDNEESSSNYWNEAAQETLNRAESSSSFTKAEQAALDLSDQLKAEHEEIVTQSGVPTTGFVADLMNAAMSEVNWHEIAESLLEERSSLIS